MGTTNTLAKLRKKPGKTGSPPTASMADALFTATQQRLISLLFGQPNRTFFVTELIELADVGRGAVQRELLRLEQAGLVLTKKQGNQKHYRANAAAPIFDEMCSIARKTIGVEEQVRVALYPLAEHISLALIYGSVAKQVDSAKSDIDLLIVSEDLTLEELYSQLSTVEKQLGRPINPTLYTSEEFRQRRVRKNPFLNRVLAGPIALLRGEIDVP